MKQTTHLPVDAYSTQWNLPIYNETNKLKRDLFYHFTEHVYVEPILYYYDLAFTSRRLK